MPTYSDGSARIAALLAAGPSVSIPDGVYLMTSPMSPRSGQVIAPANAGKVVIKAAPGYAGQLVNSVDVSYTIRGLVFDGAYSARTAQEGQQGASLVSITGGTNVTFDGNTFQYGPSYGINGYRATTLQVLNNKFVEVYAPVYLNANNLQAGTIKANTFTNTAAFHSYQTIEAVNTKALVVEGNTMSGIGLGVPVSHGYEGTWGNGIYIWNSDGYQVLNNTVGAGYWSSLVSGQNGTNATIRGNHFSDGPNSYTAVWIEQAGNLNQTLDGNVIDGAVEVGDTGGDYVTITNNQISSRHFGINLNFAAKHVTIQNNTITSKSATRFQNGVYLWNKTDPATNVQILTNAISGFDIGVAANNDGGTGTVYGIHLSGNSFSNVNRNTWSGASVAAPWGQ